jgi:hypothetical protein
MRLTIKNKEKIKKYQNNEKTLFVQPRAFGYSVASKHPTLTSFLT